LKAKVGDHSSYNSNEVDPGSNSTCIGYEQSGAASLSEDTERNLLNNSFEGCEAHNAMLNSAFHSISLRYAQAAASLETL